MVFSMAVCLLSMAAIYSSVVNDSCGIRMIYEAKRLAKKHVYVACQNRRDIESYCRAACALELLMVNTRSPVSSYICTKLAGKHM